MADFSDVASFAVEHRTKFHVAIILFSLVMVPGLMQTLTPIDIESYDMDSPEMEAEKVIDDEFSSKELTVGFVVSIRDPSYIQNGHQAPHTDADGNPDRLSLPTPQEIAPFQGTGEGFSGEGIPEGGVFNLTFLRELEQKIMIARSDPLAEFYRPIVSELTGESANGTLSLFEQFEAFMGNRSLLTREATDPFGNIVPPLTNWSPFKKASESTESSWPCRTAKHCLVFTAHTLTVLSEAHVASHRSLVLKTQRQTPLLCPTHEPCAFN